MTKEKIPEKKAFAISCNNSQQEFKVIALKFFNVRVGQPPFLEGAMASGCNLAH